MTSPVWSLLPADAQRMLSGRPEAAALELHFDETGKPLHGPAHAARALGSLLLRAGFSVHDVLPCVAELACRLVDHEWRGRAHQERVDDRRGSAGFRPFLPYLARTWPPELGGYFVLRVGGWTERDEWTADPGWRWSEDVIGWKSLGGVG